MEFDRFVNEAFFVSPKYHRSGDLLLAYPLSGFDPRDWGIYLSGN